MWFRLLALALLLLPAPALADVKEKVATLAPSGLVLVVDGKGNELVAQVRLIDHSRCCPSSEADCKNDTVRSEARRLGRASVYRGVGVLKAKIVMERVFIGATRAEATRMADEWWGRQKGLRQTLRTEVAVGRKGPDAQLDQWAITIRFEDETSG